MFRNLNASQESVDSENISKHQVGGGGPDEEEADTDLETDRLLGQQRLDDHDDKVFFLAAINLCVSLTHVFDNFLISGGKNAVALKRRLQPYRALHWLCQHNFRRPQFVMASEQH